MGILGHHNWQWIFILEGLFTIIVGLVAFFFVVDFPEEVTWLSKEEKNFVIARARGTGQAQRITRSDLLLFFQDTGNVLGDVMYLGRSMFQSSGIIKLICCSRRLCHTHLRYVRRLVLLNQLIWLPLTAFAYFTPTIVKTYGYSVVQIQLHSVPPLVAAFALCIITTYLSDRTKLR